MKILMVLTSHDQLGDTGEKTGFWLEEFACPYYVFKEAGVAITLASPDGGQPPLDPRSNLPDFQTAFTRRFLQDQEAQQQLASTQRLDEVKPEEYAAVFYPGGHGPLWDLAESEPSMAALASFYQSGKPIGLVCHAPGVLRHVKNEQGDYLVKGKRVTGFSNSEEEAVQLTKVVPFLVEDMLKDRGGRYEKAGDWESFVVVDGQLITGQNPASSEATAKAVLKASGDS